MKKSPFNWQEVARLVLLSREMDLLEEEHLAPQGKVNTSFPLRVTSYHRFS